MRLTVRCRLRWVLVVLALVAAGCSASAQPARSPSAADLGASAVYRNQVFAQRDTGPLALDLYLPASEPKPVPLVVFAHGGGWEAGDRHLDGPMAGSIEAQTAAALVSHGYALATVDYRLSGVAQAPAQVLDVSDAVRWLQEQGGRWNLDGSRILLWGESAGGQIVAQLGAVVGDASKSGGALHGIRGVVDWFGPSDMSAEALVDHPELKDYSRRVVQKLLGCVPADCPGRADESSPIKNLTSGIPPFLIQHGTADSIVPIDQSLNLAAALRQRGVPVAMHPYERLDHGFPPRSPLTPQIVDTVVAFADTSLNTA
jgi:acetyl esterase/lipase